VGSSPDYSTSPYYAQAVQAAQTWGVPPNLFVQQIGAESGFDPGAYNPKSGATGIAQFLPSTAQQAGYGIAPFDPADPEASLNAAAAYDKALYGQTGSWGGALRAYSGSSGGSAYPGSSGVQSALATLGENMGGVQNASMSYPWDFKTPNFLGSGQNTPGDAAGAAVGEAIPVVPAVKRGLLFLLAIVIIGVGLWMFGSGNDLGGLGAVLKKGKNAALA